MRLTSPLDDVSYPKSVEMIAKVGKIDRKPKCARTFECDAIECETTCERVKWLSKGALSDGICLNTLPGAAGYLETRM